MCKKRFIYLDNSNVWIEGRYHSAVSNGTACDVQEAHDMGIYDMNWRHDFGKLIEVASESNVMSVMAAVMVGSRPPEKDSLWKTAEAAGFKTEIMDRNSAGREKGIDSKFVIKIMEDLLTGKIGEKDCVVIGVGDRLEVWSKDRWEGFIETNEDSLSDIADNLFSNLNISAEKELCRKWMNKYPVLSTASSLHNGLSGKNPRKIELIKEFMAPLSFKTKAYPAQTSITKAI